MTLLEIQELNIREKEAFFQGPVREVPRSKVSKPSRKKRKASPDPGTRAAPRKSQRLEERPGPAPEYHEEGGEASGHQSRREGSAGSGARARSRPQLRPRRPINYVEEEVDSLDSIIYCSTAVSR